MEGRLEDAGTLLSGEQRNPVDLNLEWVLGKMPRKVCCNELFLTYHILSMALLFHCTTYSSIDHVTGTINTKFTPEVLQWLSFIAIMILS